MLKTLTSALFLTMILASAPSLAANPPAPETHSSQPASETAVLHATTAHDANPDYLVNQEANVSSSASASAWMLGLALLGFVMLSNRRGV